MRETLAPGLLIAVPQLQDPNFRQAVVFLLECNADGALGLVVNRDSAMLLSDLCQDHQIPYSGAVTKRVRSGGPVQPEQGLVLYGEEYLDPEGREVCGGLFMSASRGTLTRLCDLASGRFQCYSGYSGWGPGQLEREIEEGSWVHGTVEPDCVLDLDPENMWNEVLRRQGIEPGALVSGGSVQA